MASLLYLRIALVVIYVCCRSTSVSCSFYSSSSAASAPDTENTSATGLLLSKSESTFDTTTTPHYSPNTPANTAFCPDHCTCSPHVDTPYISSSYADETNCSNRGLVLIPSTIDPSTKYLYLARNQISVLHNASIRNLTLLIKLDLCDNHLVMIEPDAFLGLQSLLWLWLDGAVEANTILDSHVLRPLVSLNLFSLRRSHLNMMPSDFFTQNKDVLCIYLSDNELRSIPEGLFQGLEELAEVHLENNRIQYLPNDMFKGDFDLELIYLQNNYIKSLSKNIGFQRLSALELLNLKGNQLSVLRNGSFGNIISLIELDLSDNQLITIEPDAFLGLRSLQMLWLNGAIEPKTILDSRLLHPLVSLRGIVLSHCHLKLLPSGFFANNPDIYHIDLSGNELTAISEGLFRGLDDVTVLHLENNRIQYLQPDMFDGNFNLDEIYLQNNSIEIVSQNVGFQNLPLKVLNIDRNPFSCNCSLAWFSAWMNSDTYINRGHPIGNFSGHYELECLSPKSHQGVKLVDLYRHLDCSHHGGYVGVKIGTSLGVLVIVGTLLAWLTHRYRWFVRFYWFVIRARCRGWRNMHSVSDADQREHEYDVFVSYNSADKEWVMDHLIPTLEGEPHNLKVCVDYKNFEYGGKILDNILNGIQRSRKTALILSPSFVDSEWCYFELEMAIWRLFAEQRDVAVMVLLEPIPKDKIPLLLRRLMKKRVYAKWTDDPGGQRLFWEKLVAALKSPNETKRRKTIRGHNVIV